MKITIPISLGVLLVWAQGAEAAGGFLSLPMARHTPSQALVRRQTDVSLPVAYHRNAYLIDVDIGTPKQRVQLAVDVGSYGIMVMGKCETRYSSDTSDCEKMGAYNASLSTTGVFIAKDDFDEGLDLDGDETTDMTWATRHTYADDVTIAGQGTLNNKTFGAYQSSEAYQHGVLGLGFGGSGTEPGILGDLAAEGLIGARAFGITLGGGVDSGSLVLGGVDTKKFSGPLTKVPVVDAPQGAESWELNRYWMNVGGVALNDGNGVRTSMDGFTAEAQITSTYSSLPGDIVVGVAEALGVRNWTDPNWYIVPCSQGAGVNDSLELEISGFTASIPYADLLLPYEGPDGKDGDCYITVQPGGYSREISLWHLGTPFLRSVYAVFDQDNKAVWMAKHADCGSEPVVFSQGSDVRGKCEGNSSGEASSGEGGSPDKDDGEGGGSGGSRMGVEMALILGAALAPLIVLAQCRCLSNLSSSS